MNRMGQTFKGDLDGGAEMCAGGSLGPVGSPGWRRREKVGRVLLKLRVSKGRRVSGRVRRGDMVVGEIRWVGEGEVCCEVAFWVSVGLGRG